MRVCGNLGLGCSRGETRGRMGREEVKHRESEVNTISLSS